MWLGYGYDGENFSSRDILKRKFLSSHCGSLRHDLLSGFHILLSSSRQNARFSYTLQCHLPNTLHLIIKWRVCLFTKLTWQFKNNIQDHKGKREVQLPNLISLLVMRRNQMTTPGCVFFWDSYTVIWFLYYMIWCTSVICLVIHILILR